MSDSEAVVARVDGEFAWLEVCKPVDCENCSSAEGCGLGRTKRLQRVRNTIGAQVGDTVIVSVPAGALLKAAMFSYLLPLVLALLSAGVGSALAADSGALIGMVGGLASGLVVLRFAGIRLGTGREPLLSMRIKLPVVQQHRDLKS